MKLAVIILQILHSHFVDLPNLEILRESACVYRTIGSMSVDVTAHSNYAIRYASENGIDVVELLLANPLVNASDVEEDTFPRL
jgi:hypothetical protein